MISAGTIVGGRYRVVNPLGGGGMKLVYLAEDLRLSARPCALAEMVDSFTSPEMQQVAVAGFQREADMLAGLDHEHIPRIYDRFSDQNRHYLVMEYIAGGTLEDELKSAGGKIGEERVTDIALQVLETLAYLHGLEPPVIYRDLKPSNIMLTASGQVKLIDFGIARYFQPLSNATMIGTQGYAPPEQYRGKVEARSDLYALGATMHHAISGRDPTTEPPFSFPALRKLCPDCNPALADIVDNMLSYDVDRRIARASDVRKRLLALKSAPPISLEPPVPIEKSRQFRLALGAGRKAPPPQASPKSQPSAPTLLTATSGVPCPGCGMQIPSDSRFCSYCAADLRRILAPGETILPNDKTVVLGPATEHQPAFPSGAASRLPQRPARKNRRFPFWPLALTFIGVYLAVRVIPYLMVLFAALGLTGEPTDAPGSMMPPARYSSPGGIPPQDSEPPHRSAQGLALRNMLDQQGYRGVHFRLIGGAVELWGRVRSEADRLIVETIAMSASGSLSINDRLTVENEFAGP